MNKTTGLLISLIFFLFHFSSFAQSWLHYDSLRTIYQKKQSFDTALVYAEKSLNLVKEKVGETDTLFANMLLVLVEINYYFGKYQKAIEYGEKEREIRKIRTGTKNYAYVNSCEWLGSLYQLTGNYNAAELLFIDGMNIAKIVLGEKNPEYATTINNLAELYHVIGNYSEALPLLLEAEIIYKKTFGENHSDYARALHNLAGLYQEMGNFSAAEPLYLKAKLLYKEIFGEKHQSYTQPLNGLASLYLELGNYHVAEQLYLEILNIRKNTLGENDRDYATSLNNLANVYLSIKDYSAAEPLFVKAMKIWKTTLGEKHPTYSYSLNNLAVLYLSMGNYILAEPLLLESKKVRKEVFGEKHPLYSSALDNLAGLYFEIKNYTLAESLYIEAKNSKKEVLGDKHLDYAFVLNNLAQFYCQTGNYTVAEPLYLEYLDILNNAIKQNFAFLSEKEKEMFFKTMSEKYSDFYSFSLRRKSENNDITKIVYNNVVKNKGLLLKSTTAMRTAILNSKDTSLIEKYKKWIILKKEISKLNSKAISKRKKNPDELEQEANKIEKDLVRGSQVFSDFEKLQNLSWETVKNSLKPEEAAIEFIRFSEGKKEIITFYCALIITPQSKQPEMIKLFNEKELELILGTNNKNNLSYINNIYGTSKNTNEKLFKLIWQPLEKYLEGIKIIYYSPDGLLHKISFSSIAKGKDIFLCDNYSLNRLSNTGKIAYPEIFNISNDITAGIYGGIDYSSGLITEKNWQYLPGSKNETDKINSIFISKKIKTNYFFGKKADENEFKASAANVNLLHIATHGFFFPEPEAIKNIEEKKNEVTETTFAFRGGTTGFGVWHFVMNKNPLMRSGLVLAGANNVWNQKIAADGEDGVLTALEVTQLDLQKTQLVVLSACETGLGDIKGSEGVYGLQRAFKMAGVKFIIMSLWQVPDNETSEFMTKFYENLLTIKDIRKSFNETQTEMRKKYDPFYWASFVLIE